MQHDTVGNPIIFYDACAFCEIDTSGNHQLNCPCHKDTNITSSSLLVKEIPKPFVQLFFRCPCCQKGIRFDGFIESLVEG